MFGAVVISVFLAIVPVLLWSIPKTRRMTGDRLVALKTVPLGCLSIFLIPTLLYGIIKFINNRWELSLLRDLRHIWPYYRFGIVAIGLIVGILLIVYLTRLIRWRYHAEGKRSWLPFLLIFLFLGASTIVLSVTLPVVRYLNNMPGFRGEWRTFVLPPENDVKIAFEECSIHPFLAEYDYRLCFKYDGRTEYCNLQTNCGGRTFFNLYRLKDGRLYFIDKDGEYIVDAAQREVLFIKREQAKIYAVPYPKTKFDSWGWGMESGKMIFHHGNQKVEAYSLSIDLDDKVYYGCITDDFYLAAEKPEQPIERKEKHK